MNDIAILIPAYNPDENLISLIDKLIENNFDYKKIIVVDDGSNNKDIFIKLQSFGVKVLYHTKNQGKGSALKTGFDYCLKNYNDISGIVTADCDGQHFYKDILFIASNLSQNHNYLYLGCRNLYQKNVPFKSIIGNLLINFLLRFFFQLNLSDSQTGLRGLPIEFAKKCIYLDGKYFDYEMRMLMLAKKEKINIVQCRITTYYFNKNKKSNYRTFLDSFLILRTILKNNIKSV